MMRKSLISTLVLVTGLNAWADENHRPMIEVSGGYEYEVVGVTVPRTFNPSEVVNASDPSRSGARVSVAVRGVRFETLVGRSNASVSVSFLPFTAVIDASNADATHGFGRVVGADGGGGNLRRLYGVLVEGSYQPTGLVQVRGKLAQVEYDRDRGFWDWRALDASVAITKAWQLDGQLVVDLDVSVGGNFGGIHLNRFDDVQRALAISPIQGSALTINPHAAIRAGLSGRDFRVELSGTAEHRVDLTPEGDRPSYIGNRVGVDSQHVQVALDGQYVIWRDPSREGRSGQAELSVFANAAYEYDNLTISNAFFGTNDAFNSFRFMGGLRGRF
jgi:hypothetical protein